MTGLNPTYSAMLADLQRRIERLELSRRAEATSIGAGGLTVQDEGAIRSSDFDGDLTGDPGAAGWAVGAGNAIFNVLTLRDGIIGVDALDEPLGYASDVEGVTDFSIPPGVTTHTSTAIAVPDWANVAYVHVQFFVMGVVDSAEASHRYLRGDVVVAGGVTSSTMYSAGTPPGSLTNSVTGGVLHTVSAPGSTITCDVRTSHSGTVTWAASSFNRALLRTFVFFLR